MASFFYDTSFKSRHEHVFSAQGAVFILLTMLFLNITCVIINIMEEFPFTPLLSTIAKPGPSL